MTRLSTLARAPGTCWRLATLPLCPPDSRHTGPGFIARAPASCMDPIPRGPQKSETPSTISTLDNKSENQHLQSLHLECGRFGNLLACVPTLPKGPMLKISIIEGHTQRRLIVEGKLAGPWAAELKGCVRKGECRPFRPQARYRYEACNGNQSGRRERVV